MPPRFWISLTTTPTRIHLIRPVLESLVHQTAPVEGVLLNVPYRLQRNGAAYQLPAWLHELPCVRVNRSADYGPATKLLGALEVEREPDAYIIVVDDDTVYPLCMVEAYRNCDLGGRQTVYCTAGFNISDPLDCCREVRGNLEPVRGHMVPVQVVEGYGSVLYRRGLFHDDIFHIMDLPEYVVYSDDLYLSNYLGRHRVLRWTIAPPGFGGDGFWKDRVLAYGREGDALHLGQRVGSNRERYAQAIRYFLENKIYWLGGGALPLPNGRAHGCAPNFLGGEA
ncbi:MAG: hypothetical protein ABSG65_04710 [Bryobacteraceae bacterium]